MTDEEILKQFKRWAQDRSCIQCGHFNEIKELCVLYKQRPPAKVIVNGCPSHDYLPF